MPILTRRITLRGIKASPSYAGGKVTKAVTRHPAFNYIRGSAPISGPQGNINVTAQFNHRMRSGTLYPAPVTSRKEFATGHAVARTVAVGGVPLQNKRLGVPAFQGNPKPYGGPPPTPLMLGSNRQVGFDTIRRPVFQPPQTLIPGVMRKIFGR